jgi:hypothetical protein
MDFERLEALLANDPTLSALVASGTAQAPLLELAARVAKETQPLLEQIAEPATGAPERLALTAAVLDGAAALARLAERDVEAQRIRLGVVAPTLACARGCAACCHLRVEISPLEAERLAPVVRALGLEGAVRARAETVGGLSRSERVHARIPCALLDAEGACSVHAVRPLACRAANSLDRRACERAVNVGDGLLTIPVDPVPLGLARASALGVEFASAALGRETAPSELHVGVARALTRPH